jgi:hypothetical protein
MTARTVRMTMKAAPLDMASASIGENKRCIILPFVFDGNSFAV